MIVMYPMLVSTTVSGDTLPAISKVLEKFILLYRMESISSRLSYLDKAGVVAGIFGAAKTGTTLLTLGKEHDKTGELLGEQSKGLKPVLKTAGNIAVQVSTGGEKRGLHFEVPKRESLSLEPTYVEMQHPKIGTIIIGVKVLPFTVSSEYNLLYYLSHDMSSNWLESELKSRWRRYGRIAWTILRALKFPIVGSPFRRSVSGDPQKDIAYASTVFKHNVFCLINFNDSVSEMIKNPGTLRKMYKLGWNSLVFADDINRRSVFCMQEFQGLCSTIPYSVMGASFGKEYQDVFRNMEEVRKSSSSFFSSLKSPGSFFSEHFTLDKYLDVMQEQEAGAEELEGGGDIDTFEDIGKKIEGAPEDEKEVAVSAKRVDKKKGQEHIDEKT